MVLVLVGAAGAAGCGGGAAGRVSFGTSFAYLVRTQTFIIPIKLGFHSIGLRAAITLQSAVIKALLLSVPYNADWTDPMKF